MLRSNKNTEHTFYKMNVRILSNEQVENRLKVSIAWCQVQYCTFSCASSRESEKEVIFFCLKINIV